MHPEESSCHEDDNCNAFKHWYDWILAPAGGPADSDPERT